MKLYTKFKLVCQSLQQLVLQTKSNIESTKPADNLLVAETRSWYFTSAETVGGAVRHL
jgi:hypothetical protein